MTRDEALAIRGQAGWRTHAFSRSVDVVEIAVSQTGGACRPGRAVTQSASPPGGPDADSAPVKAHQRGS